MIWVVAFVLPLAAGCFHAYRVGADRASACEIVLRYLCGGLFGVWMIFTGACHVLFSRSVAEYIGWTPGSPFQLELGFASIGLGIMALRLALLRTGDRLAAWLGGAISYLGAAGIHVVDMAQRSNFNDGNAGAVFYVDILAPLFALGLWLGSRHGSSAAPQSREPLRV